MLFNLEGDVGVIIKGYVIPDAYDKYATVVLRNAGRDIFTSRANHPMEYQVAPNRHVTHNCRYYIDIYNCPNLDKYEDLELWEKDSNQLLFRRRKPAHISKKIFRLETHLLPLWRIDQTVDPKFQYYATRVENHGRETFMQLLTLWHLDSVYLSGRILYKSVEHYLQSYFQTVFIMHHPYEELAERLLVLRQMSEMGAELLGERDSNALKPLIAFAASLSLTDERAISRVLRDMPRDVAALLSNPVTMQLTSLFPEETLSPRALTLALDALSTFEIVGLRRAPNVFLKALAELTEVPLASFPAVDRLPGVTALAKLLKSSRAVDGLLELDLHLYSHIAEAYRKAGVAPGAPGAKLPVSA